MAEDRAFLKHPFFTSDTGVEFTWTNKRVLGAPRSQEDTQTCVHFVMVAMLGALVALNYGLDNGMVPVFAIQHIIDCMDHKSKKVDKCGCYSSNFQEVFNFLKKGIVEESVYPFKGKKGICRDPQCDEDQTTEKGRRKRMLEEPEIPEESKRARVEGELQKVKITDFEKMKSVIEKGPVAITVKLTKEFMAFRGNDDVKKVFPLVKKSAKKKNTKGSKSEAPSEGLSQHSGSGDEHALLVIGYGTDPETKRRFYLVINSWPSTAWGFHSYGKIAVDMFNKGSELEDNYAYYFENVTFS